MSFLPNLRERRPLDLRFELDDRLLRVYNVYRRLQERRLDEEHRCLLKQNRELLDLHRGERCWIIGNGPSIRDQDLTRLRGEHTFVVNRFIHHERAEEIDPTYYCITDPKFGTGAWGTDFVDQIKERLPNVVLFLTVEGERLCREKGILRDHRRFVIHPNQQMHFGFDRDIDLTRGVPGGDNVTKAALSVAVYMGFEDIRLLGIDGSGLLLTEDSHFYGNEPNPKDQLRLEKDLVSMALGLRSWRAYMPYLERRGIRLVSMNPKSVLTALPYQPYEPIDEVVTQG